MEYIEKCYITLDSMGDALDSLMENACPGVGFVPSVGSRVYNNQVSAELLQLLNYKLFATLET